MPARRILSLWFPRLGAERLARLRRGLPEGPLATVTDLPAGQMLVSLSAAAEAAGLTPGQSLRDARAMCPTLATVPRNAAAEAAFLAALARWAGRFSPWVAVEPPAALLIDLWLPPAAALRMSVTRWAQAMKRVRRLRRGLKFYVYVVNSQEQLSGVVTLHELLNAPAARLISDIMVRKVVSLRAGETMPLVAQSPYWRNYNALPVTDQDGVLVGVIRQRNLRRFLDSRQVLNGPGSGVGVVLSVGELFSVTAGQLLSTLMSAAMSGGGRGAAGDGYNDGRRR